MNDKLREALETIRSIAEWMNVSVQCVQNHPEEPPDYASEFDYKMAQASSELFNAIEIFDAQALAASKQEPLEKLTRLTEEMGLYPWQEPQARAGETEPSKFDLRYERLHKILSHGHDTNGIDEPMHFVFHLWIGYERELAILATEAKAELTSNRQAIAKKDAALKACVEALEKARQWHNGDKWREGNEEERAAWEAHRDLLDEALAAITQAEEAMK